MILGIVAASASEAKTLLGFEPIIGKVYSLGHTTLLAVAGVGEFSARVAAEGLLENGAGALLSWGVAAGLQPGLKAGDIVLPTVITDDRNIYQVSRAWHTAMKKRITKHTQVCEGAITHTDSLLTLPKYKQALYSYSNAVAVDRESLPAAAVAKKAKVPFLALKVIADTAGTRLPAVLTEQRNMSLSQTQLLTTLGTKPWQWGSLLKLSLCSRLAISRLHKMAKKQEFDFLPPVNATRRRMTTV